MKLVKLLKVLTKYYKVVVKDHKNTRLYEDQTVVPEGISKREVETCDFYEDDGEGEMLLINLCDEMNKDGC